MSEIVQAYPTYAKHPDDDFAKNGYCRYVIDQGDATSLIEQGHNIVSSGKLIREPKDAGALKVDKSTLKTNSKYYAELLANTGLFRAVQEDVKSLVFPRKISHLVNDEATKTLIWHRDSYQHNGTQIGPLPSPLKLAVYLTDVDEYSSVTGINPLFPNIDFNNRYIDIMLAYLLKPFAIYHRLSAGTAILFDGKLMHCRPKHRKGDYRQVIIFSLSQDPGQLPTIEAIPTELFGMLHALMVSAPEYERRILEILKPKAEM